MPPRPRILVVEDETAIRHGICDVLVYKGYDPVGAADGAEGLRLALEGGFDLLVLDIMLPGVDGFTICRRVREAIPGQAILLLTAKGAESDILEGFEAGADDYVTKPFSVSQLVARVKALLRRVGARPPQRFHLADLEVDGERQQARGPGGQCSLTPLDVDLLAYLATVKGRGASRQELLQEVWGYQRVDNVETRCVDMHIAKLRRKLSEASAAAIIETVRGSGYRLADED